MTSVSERLRRRREASVERHGYRLLFKDSVIYGGGRALVKLLSALLLPLYSFYLSPADYGVLGIILTTTTLIDVIVSIGIDVAFSRFYFDEKTEANHRKVITTVFYIKTLYGGLLLGLLALFAPQISELLLGTAAYALYFNISLINEFFTNWSDLPFTLYRLDHRPLTFVAFTGGRVLIQVPVTVVLVAVFHQGPLGVLIGNAVTAFVLNALALPSYWKRIEWRPDWGHMKAMLDFAAPAIFTTLSFYVLKLSDRYFLIHYRGVKENGLYTVAQSISQPVYVVMMAFRMAWPQWHYAKLKDPVEHKKLVARSSTYFLAFCLFMGAIMAVFMPMIVRLLLTNSDFWDVGPTALVLSFSTIAYSAYFIFWVGSNVAKKNRLIPVIAAIAGGVNVGLNFWAVPAFGMWGAAWTTLLGYSLLAFMVYFISQHYYPVQFEWTRLLKLCAATGVTMVAAWLLGRAVGITTHLEFWHVMLKQLEVAPAILLFPLTLWLIGFFTARERRGILRKLRLERRPAAKPAPAAAGPARAAGFEMGTAAGAAAVLPTSAGAQAEGVLRAEAVSGEDQEAPARSDTDEEELEEEELEEEEIEAKSELPSGGGIV